MHSLQICLLNRPLRWGVRRSPFPLSLWLGWIELRFRNRPAGIPFISREPRPGTRIGVTETGAVYRLSGVAGLALAFTVGACTPGQQQVVSTVSTAIAAACSTATPFVPLADGYAPYITAACMTEQGLAKLASDPSSLEWLNTMMAKVKALAARKVMS